MISECGYIKMHHYCLMQPTIDTLDTTGTGSDLSSHHCHNQNGSCSCSHLEVIWKKIWLSLNGKKVLDKLRQTDYRSWKKCKKEAINRVSCLCSSRNMNGGGEEKDTVWSCRGLMTLDRPRGRAAALTLNMLSLLCLWSI